MVPTKIASVIYIQNWLFIKRTVKNRASHQRVVETHLFPQGITPLTFLWACFLPQAGPRLTPLQQILRSDWASFRFFGKAFDHSGLVFVWAGMESLCSVALPAPVSGFLGEEPGKRVGRTMRVGAQWPGRASSASFAICTLVLAPLLGNLCRPPRKDWEPLHKHWLLRPAC